MRSASRCGTIIVLAAIMGIAALPASDAFHFYRGPDAGCTPADGDLTDDPGLAGPASGGVRLLHNSFHDTKNVVGVSIVKVGESVTWSWNSEHCHSVRADDGSFYSGFHYPVQPPTTPATPEPVSGLFAYPVPTLAPTMTFTHTFTAPGAYTYQCEHHAVIGMVGVVIVQ